MSAIHPLQTLDESLFHQSADCTALPVTTTSEMQRLPSADGAHDALQHFKKRTALRTENFRDEALSPQATAFAAVPGTHVRFRPKADITSECACKPQLEPSLVEVIKFDCTSTPNKRDADPRREASHDKAPVKCCDAQLQLVIDPLAIED